MNAGQHAASQGHGFLSGLLSIVITVLLAIGLAWLARTFIFQSYRIPSGSMETAIMEGDWIISEKISYRLGEPEQGDIVTFQDPKVPGRVLIKRCIATEGQIVNLNDEDGLVYVDGTALDEPYTNGLPSYTLPSDVTYPCTVPEGCIWVMGDNRTNSQDSRYFGPVEVSSLTGRAMFTYYPFDRLGKLG